MAPAAAPPEPRAIERMVAAFGRRRLDALAPETVAKARLCVLDVLAGCCALPDDARTAAAEATAADIAGAGAPAVGRRRSLAPADAAFVNAVASATSETNDTHGPTATHPGIAVIPAVLALAAARGLTGAAALEGIVAGYEMMGRLARVVITPEIVRIYRSSGLVGPTAAAFGAAVALRLADAGIANAAALATHTAGGFNEWANAGTGEHVFQIGFAARNGVLAALLAEAGATAAPGMLDGEAGLFRAMGAEGRAAGLLRPEAREEIHAVVHKPAPACFFVQTPCQVAARVAAEAGIRADDVEAVDVTVSDTARRFPGCDNPGPMRTRQDASMSIQFSVAAVIAAGRISHAAWARWDDPATNRLAARVRLNAQGPAVPEAPGMAPARVRIALRGGGAVHGAAADFASMTGADIAARFLDAAGPVLGAARAERLAGLVGRLETLPDCAVLSPLLAPPNKETTPA